MRHQPSNGFTLIELSIVLVIIGLIIGGVMAGRELIYAAQIRATVSEYGDYRTRINTFKLKYNYLPGDLPNATSFFDAGTFSGAGNGTVTDSFVAWQQMGKAGYISCACTGVLAASAPRTRINFNVSPSKYSSQSLFWVEYHVPDASYYTYLSSANYLELTTEPPASAYPSVNTGTTPADALQIDSKMDDGLPFTGALRAQMYHACDSITGVNSYNLVTVQAIFRSFSAFGAAAIGGFSGRIAGAGAPLRWAVIAASR